MTNTSKHPTSLMRALREKNTIYRQDATELPTDQRSKYVDEIDSFSALTVLNDIVNIPNNWPYHREILEGNIPAMVVPALAIGAAAFSDTRESRNTFGLSFQIPDIGDPPLEKAQFPWIDATKKYSKDPRYTGIFKYSACYTTWDHETIFPKEDNNEDHISSHRTQLKACDDFLAVLDEGETSLYRAYFLQKLLEQDWQTHSAANPAHKPPANAPEGATKEKIDPQRISDGSPAKLTLVIPKDNFTDILLNFAHQQGLIDGAVNTRFREKYIEHACKTPGEFLDKDVFISRLDQLCHPLTKHIR